MHVAHDEVELRLRVRQMRWEAEGVLSLLLEAPDGAALPRWSPGAHVDLHLPGVITRQYSLCGSPSNARQWRIAVLREQAGRGGSAAVHTTLRPGDVVDVVGPRNNFALADAASYLFIAGGIGITPLLPMIEAAEARGSRWRLAYGGRTRSAMAFAGELLESHGSRVTFVPQDECGLLDLDGLLEAPPDDELVYCCGPEPLLSAVELGCSARPQALHVERFAARPREQPDPSTEPTFEVELQRTGRTVTVPGGLTILEALEAAGIEAASSCREGICGTCETNVLDGLPDHRDSLLSEEERAANDTMMICVGRSRSSRLVLDL